MDLYKILGVARDASVEMIRRAYRKKAKNAHPDTGGSEGDWATLNFAHITLTDQRKRAHYDATGKVESGPDPEELLRRQVVQYLSQLVGQLIMNEGTALTEDMRELCQKATKEQLRQVNDAVVKANVKMNKVKKFLGRWRLKKKGDNLFESVINANIVALQAEIDRIGQNKPVLEGALVVLEDYEFRFDVPEPVVGDPWGQYSPNFAKAHLAEMHRLMNQQAESQFYHSAKKAKPK